MRTRVSGARRAGSWTGRRESQAAFRCRSCGYAANADVNAACNIRHAAGHAVSARGGPPLGEPANREPQRALLLVG
ncbi:zinc ribbon domain-containing protein [Streptosporangium sp. NPDC051023]|uniref:zinc ribbon domain-containing protein n=1 Tax=Streptosporangium sp. NPDC051023 TaxID=3155410 RepID=UPI00344EA2F1